MKRTNRLLSLLLVFLMVLTLVPTTVFAEGKAEITPIFELPKLEVGKQVDENSITVNNDAIEITRISWHTQEKRAVLKSEIGTAYDEFASLNSDCKLADYSRTSLDHTDHYSKETHDYEVVWKGTTPWNRGTTAQYETFPFNFHAGSQYIAYVQFRVKDGYTLDLNNSVYVRIGSGGSLITKELPISEDGYLLRVNYDALADQDISQVNLKSKLNAGQTWSQLQQQLNFSADAQGCNVVTEPSTSVRNKNPDPNNKYRIVRATGFWPAIFDKTDTSKNHDAKINDDYTYFPGGLYGNDSLIEGHRYEVVLYLRPLLGYDFKNFGSEKSAKSFWKSGKLTLTDSSTDQTINGSYIKRKGTAFWKNEQKSYRAGQPGFETTYYCDGMFPTYLYDTMEVKFTFTVLGAESKRTRCTPPLTL